MTMVMPVFPFFEVARPARSAIPLLDECTFTAPPAGTPAGLPLPAIPTLDEIIAHYETLPVPPIIATFNSGFLHHQKAYASVMARLTLATPARLLPATTAGLAMEMNAMAAVTSTFGATPSPAWSKGALAPGPHVLSLEGIFSSVPLVENGRIAAVLDQLWVVTDGNCRILVAVEIDGDDKWDEQHDGSASLTQSQISVARSNLILSKGVGIYRIASVRCAAATDATSEIEELWKRLCATEFLRRMAMTGNRLLSETDADAVFDHAVKKYLKSNKMSV